MNFNPKCDIRVHISNSFVISSRCGKYWKRFIGAPLELEVGKLKIIIFFSTDPEWKLNTRKEKSNNAIKGNDFFLQ